MGMMDYLEIRWRNVLKDSIFPETIKTLAVIESIMKAGFLRVMYCLHKAHYLRFAELEKLTKLPRATLLKLLKELRDFGLINIEEREVTEPRKEKAPHYTLTNNGKKFCKEFLFVNDKRPWIFTIGKRSIENPSARRDFDDTIEFLNKNLVARIKQMKDEKEMRKK
jgi:DNA-binding HxlR family transcriptional regulator